MGGAPARYEWLEALHTSLFGEIRLCRDRETDCRVVVKTVDLTMALRQESEHYGPVQENIVRELEVLSHVASVGGHPNVIRMHNFFVLPETNTLHVVLDYCEGGDLLDACSGSPARAAPTNEEIIELEASLELELESDDESAPTKSTAPAEDSAVASPSSPPVQSRVTEALALGYVHDIASGLSFLHRNGIAHRDLSLENILLRHGRAVIADFGLCVMQGHDVRCLDVVGKHYYMAPEIVAEQLYDPKKADVWSLGIVLFILLTASPPFEIGSMMDPSFRFMATYGLGAILKAWGLENDVSASTQVLLEQMTALDPDDRPTVDEVLHHPALFNVGCDEREDEAGAATRMF